MKHLRLIFTVFGLAGTLLLLPINRVQANSDKDPSECEKVLTDKISVESGAKVIPFRKPIQTQPAHRFDIFIDIFELLDTHESYAGSGVSASDLPKDLSYSFLERSTVHRQAGTFLQTLHNLGARIHLFAEPGATAFTSRDLDAFNDLKVFTHLLSLIPLPNGTTAESLIATENIHLSKELFVPGFKLTRKGEQPNFIKLDFSRVQGLDLKNTLVIGASRLVALPGQERSFVNHWSRVSRGFLHAQGMALHPTRFGQVAGELQERVGGMERDYFFKKLAERLSDNNRFSFIIGAIDQALTHQSSEVPDAGLADHFWSMQWLDKNSGQSVDYNEYLEKMSITDIAYNREAFDNLETYRHGSKLMSKVSGKPEFIPLFTKAEILFEIEKRKDQFTPEDYTRILKVLDRLSDVPRAKSVQGHVNQMLMRTELLLSKFSKTSDPDALQELLRRL